LQTLATTHEGHVLIVRIKARRAFLTSRRMPGESCDERFPPFRNRANAHRGELFPARLRRRGVPAAGRGSATGNG
jgi:hypothetical protein